uniref:Chemosensory protein 4 n=1 Tax=Yemma signatus TaxID=300820 RepID=A0A3G2GRR2_9HEMI|nr:chemosensory protein 4 [Yemma signatus]
MSDALRSMRSAGQLVLLFLGLALVVLAQEEDYEKAFESVDPDEILNNDRILDSYVRCFLGTGSCNEHAATIKKTIPEVMSTVCGKCSDKQKAVFKHSLEVFIPKRPEDWKKMLKAYDPNGEYEPKIMEFLKTWTPPS